MRTSNQKNCENNKRERNREDLIKMIQKIEQKLNKRQKNSIKRRNQAEI